ncbi:MAG: NUDIX domain-containing protein [Pseudomonadota bacterium]
MQVDWQRAAAYVVVHDHNSRLLLTQFEKIGHPQSGAWTLPGGGMEWGEQAHETAARELKEETGLDAEIGPLLGVQSQWFEASSTPSRKSGHAIRLIFRGTNAFGELKRDFSDDDTTIDAAWFDMNELHKLKRVSVVDFAIALIGNSRDV